MDPSCRPLKYLKEGIIRRDSAILQILYESFALSLLGEILSVLHDRERANRVLKRTFLYAVKDIKEHNPKLRLHGWFLQIAHFMILEEAAGAKTGKTLPDDLSLSQYVDALSKLNREDREVLELSIFRARSHEEIAAQVGITLEALQQRLYAALSHLQGLCILSYYVFMF